MTYERDHYKELVERDKRRAHTARTGELIRLASQAKPAMSKLTNQPQWDSFLQLLQALKETAEKDLQGVRASLTSPAWAGKAEQIMILRENAVRFEAEIATLENVMALPKTLLDRANEALEVARG